LLPKLGSSNLLELTLAIQQVLPLFKEYKLIVLGSREFCSVDAGILSQGNGCIFLFKAKKESLPGNRKLNLATFRPIGSHTVELRYIFTLVRVRKTRPVAGFDIACKWKRKYRGKKVKDAWFILTDLGSLPVAVAAYKQRMGIEEMFP